MIDSRNEEGSDGRRIGHLFIMIIVKDRMIEALSGKAIIMEGTGVKNISVTVAGMMIIDIHVTSQDDRVPGNAIIEISRDHHVKGNTDDRPHAFFQL